MESSVVDEYKNIIIKYGSEEFRVILPQSTTDPHTVQDLCELIEKTCCVPLHQQRVIFKGKSLLDLGATLKSYGITNNSKVMLIMGSKPSKSPAEVNALNSLKNVEVKAESLFLELEEIQEKIAHVEKGLVSEKPDIIKRLLLGNADSYMRLLESMDALDISAMPDVKTKRKTLVNKIQGYLDKNDQIKISFERSLSSPQ